MSFKPKFYHAENSNRTITSEKIAFNFEPVQLFAGTWRGVYEAKTEDEIKALDALVSDKRSAVTVLSEDEYRKKKKSAPSNSENWAPLPDTKAADQRIIPGTAVLVESPGPENQPDPKPIVTGEPVKSLDGALVVGKVPGASRKPEEGPTSCGSGTKAKSAS